MTIIDVHAHYVPENCWDLVPSGGPDRGFFAGDATGMKKRLQDMDAAGIGVQVLSPVSRFKDQDPGVVVQHNDAMAEVVHQHPDRFLGMAVLPLEEPEQASAELERCVKDLGLSGATIGTNIHGENLDDPRASYVDLNRAGTPLLEIVGEPDLRSPTEARGYVQKLRTLVQYLDICDGNMEEGSLRCDANLSVRPAGSKVLGTKTELKNINSFRFLQRALEYERDRQILTLEKGDRVVQETRLWDQTQGVTQPMRTKEAAHDYRYFPDPDLVPLSVSRKWLDVLRADLPELPDAKRVRFVEQYGIPIYNASILTANRALADYYERAVETLNAPKALSNWVMGDLLGALNDAKKDITDSPVPPEGLAGLVRLIEEGHYKVAVDFSRVPYIDSSVLGQLLHGYAQLQQLGGTLKILGLSKRIQGLLELTRLITVFEVFSDREELLNSW